jgi:hypothetical protein
MVDFNHIKSLVLAMILNLNMKLINQVNSNPLAVSTLDTHVAE